MTSYDKVTGEFASALGNAVPTDAAKQRDAIQNGILIAWWFALTARYAPPIAHALQQQIGQNPQPGLSAIPFLAAGTLARRYRAALQKLADDAKGTRSTGKLGTPSFRSGTPPLDLAAILNRLDMISVSEPQLAIIEGVKGQLANDPTLGLHRAHRDDPNVCDLCLERAGYYPAPVPNSAFDGHPRCRCLFVPMKPAEARRQGLTARTANEGVARMRAFAADVRASLGVGYVYKLKSFAGGGAGGHWVTIEEGGISTHIFIGHGGMVTKGPSHLVGSNIKHLGKMPGRTITHHPAGHEPAHAREHPSYTEHQPQEPGAKLTGQPYARLSGAAQTRQKLVQSGPDAVPPHETEARLKAAQEEQRRANTPALVQPTHATAPPTSAPDTDHADYHGTVAADHANAIAQAAAANDEPALDRAYAAAGAHINGLRSKQATGAYNAAYDAASAHLDEGGTLAGARAAGSTAALNSMRGEHDAKLTDNESRAITHLANVSAYAGEYQQRTGISFHSETPHVTHDQALRVLAGRKLQAYTTAHAAAQAHYRTADLHDTSASQARGYNVASHGLHESGHVADGVGVHQVAEPKAPTRTDTVKAVSDNAAYVSHELQHASDGRNAPDLATDEDFIGHSIGAPVPVANTRQDALDLHNLSLNLRAGANRDAYQAAFDAVHGKNLLPEDAGRTATLAAHKVLFPSKHDTSAEAARDAARRQAQRDQAAQRAEARRNEAGLGDIGANQEGVRVDLSSHHQTATYENAPITRANVDAQAHTIAGHANQVVSTLALSRHYNKPERDQLLTAAHQSHDEHMGGLTGIHHSAYVAAHSAAMEYTMRLDKGKGLNTAQRTIRQKRAEAAAKRVLAGAVKVGIAATEFVGYVYKFRAERRDAA